MPALSSEVSRVLELLDRCPNGPGRSGLAVDFVPLDEDLRPCGSSQTAVARELSKQCIGLLAEAPVSSSYLRLSLPGAQQTTILLEVLRCQQFGCFFEITARVLDSGSCAGRQGILRNRHQRTRHPGTSHTREQLPISSVGAI